MEVSTVTTGATAPQLQPQKPQKTQPQSGSHGNHRYYNPNSWSFGDYKRTATQLWQHEPLEPHWHNWSHTNKTRSHCPPAGDTTKLSHSLTTRATNHRSHSPKARAMGGTGTTAQELESQKPHESQTPSLGPLETLEPQHHSGIQLN